MSDTEPTQILLHMFPKELKLMTEITDEDQETKIGLLSIYRTLGEDFSDILFLGSHYYRDLLNPEAVQEDLKSLRKHKIQTFIDTQDRLRREEKDPKNVTTRDILPGEITTPYIHMTIEEFIEHIDEQHQKHVEEESGEKKLKQLEGLLNRIKATLDSISFHFLLELLGVEFGEDGKLRINKSSKTPHNFKRHQLSALAKIFSKGWREAIALNTWITEKDPVSHAIAQAYGFTVFGNTKKAEDIAHELAEQLWDDSIKAAKELVNPHTGERMFSDFEIKRTSQLVREMLHPEKYDVRRFLAFVNNFVAKQKERINKATIKETDET